MDIFNKNFKNRKSLSNVNGLQNLNNVWQEKTPINSLRTLFDIGPQNLVQADLEFKKLLPQLFGSGITGVLHPSCLFPHIFQGQPFYY
jgi:hypothetical protein